MDPISEIVVKKILSKIPNLITKLRLRQVCKLWGDLIEEIFHKENLWKMLCNNDYINPWVYNITEVIFPNQIRDWLRELSPDIWKKIYLFYNLWSSTVGSLNSYFRLSGFNKHKSFKDDIYSVDIQADKIAVNVNQSTIILLQIEDGNQDSSAELFKYNKKILYKTRFQSKKIMKIKLWFTDTKKWILVAHVFKKSSKKTLKFLDVATGEKLYNPFAGQKDIQNFTCAGHRLFIITSEYICECKYTESDGLVMGQYIFKLYQIFNRMEVTRLNVIEMTAKSFFEAVKISFIIKTSEDGIRVINFIISHNNNDTFEQLDFDRSMRIRTQSLFYMPMPGMAFVTSETEMIINLWHNLTETHQRINDDLERIVPIQSPTVFDVSQGYNPRSSTSSNDNQSGLSLYRMIGMEPLTITSMFLFCNILFLGLQSGKIHIYIGDSIKSFIRRDFYKLPKRKLQVSEHPIININVIDRHGIFYIIATTSKAIFINHLISR